MVPKKILIVEDEFIIADVLRNMLENAGYFVCGIAATVKEASELIKKHNPDLLLLDIYLKGALTGIDLAKQLAEMNIPFVYLSANSNQSVFEGAKATNPYGFVVKPFREKDVLVALEIAFYRHEHHVSNGLHQDNLIRNEFNRINQLQETYSQKLLKIGALLQSYIPFEYMSCGKRSNGNSKSKYNDIGFLRIGYNEYQEVGPNELMEIAKIKENELTKLAENTPHDTSIAWYCEASFTQLYSSAPLIKLIADTFKMNSHLVIPLELIGGEQFHFYFYSRRPDAYDSTHLLLAERIKNLLIDVIEKMQSTDRKLSDTHPRQDTVTIPDLSDSTCFKGIIGNSHLLLNVFDHVAMVAPSDTIVLILGETGTGKERIAECIHQLSPRKNKPFVKINCAALPVNLIESELFGHEKGAFTGAFERKIGKFELAAGGTIFLDEIGEMPLESQVKLLRVLQEKEIERLGGRSSIKVDVRIIAATNRHLEKEVAENRFRLDLYYRLNVFPILLPSLKERKEDIPALAFHFLDHYTRKIGKQISGFSDRVMENMMAYSWPGNIRELEHLVERNVLLAKGSVIENMDLPVLIGNNQKVIPAEVGIKTIHENERDYIISVLKKVNGRIWGAGGAAELLGVPPTTLNSKMKKLNIKRDIKY